MKDPGPEITGYEQDEWSVSRMESDEEQEGDEDDEEAYVGETETDDTESDCSTASSI